MRSRLRAGKIGSNRSGLDLTPRRERVVLAHAGSARVAYNCAPARVMAVMDQRAAERADRAGGEAHRPGTAFVGET